MGSLKLAWDLGRLRSCVTEEETQAISRIPISCTKAKDKRIWAPNKLGKYTVKVGYQQAIKKAASLLPAKASSSYSPPKSMWTRLWSIPTAPKVCLFMWKVARNWLASKLICSNGNAPPLPYALFVMKLRKPLSTRCSIVRGKNRCGSEVGKLAY